MLKKNQKLEAFAQLVETVHKLRAPDGCPWDRAQTHQTLRPYLIEEAYEVLDVIDEIKDEQSLENPGIKRHFREELGDLLMQVMLHSEMTDEQGAFDVYDVVQGLNEKLVRRHPHVFGEQKVDGADGALANWEKQKAKEKASDPNASVLDGLPKGLPALQKATRTLEKVTKVGFKWRDMDGALDKVEEEWREFKDEVEQEDTERMQEELGDLFFTICAVAHRKKISPEDALRGTLDRFEKRFRFVEKEIKSAGKDPSATTLEEYETYWKAAKEWLKNERP